MSSGSRGYMQSPQDLAERALLGQVGDRRHFVKTAAGLLVAAAGMPGCSANDGPPPTPPAGTGTVRATITGLNGSGSGGSFSAKLSDNTGPTLGPLNMPVPDGSGNSVADLPGVPPGSYLVTYSPPSGFQLVNPAQSPLAVNVTANSVQQISFACQASSSGGVPTGGVQGTVTQVAGGATVGGGSIEIINGGSVVSTIAISAAGSFNVGGLNPGAYTLQLHPNHAFSIGPAEPDTKPLTIVAGAVATVNFNVIPAIYYEDFQRFADTAALLSPTSGFGKTATSVAAFAINAGGAIVLDPTGGPDSNKAMQYIWPANPVACGVDYFVDAAVNFPGGGQPLPSGSLYIRVLDKLSAGFSNGNVACSGTRSYKYCIVTVSDPARLGFYLIGPSSSQTFNNDIDDKNGHVGGQGSAALGSAASVWNGNYRTWVYAMTGLKSSTARSQVFFDGTLYNDISRPWAPTNTANNVNGVEFGANINNGPDQIQSRWIREIGIYSTRPSMLNGL